MRCRVAKSRLSFDYCQAHIAITAAFKIQYTVFGYQFVLDGIYPINVSIVKVSNCSCVTHLRKLKKRQLGKPSPPKKTLKYSQTRPCTTVRDSEDILEQSPFQIYTTCWVFLALRHRLYLCICVFVFVYLCMRHLVISVLISLDQELSENVWFVWSKTS